MRLTQVDQFIEQHTERQAKILITKLIRRRYRRFATRYPGVCLSMTKTPHGMFGSVGPLPGRVNPRPLTDLIDRISRLGGPIRDIKLQSMSKGVWSYFRALRRSQLRHAIL
jgi:hypothetical protein